MTEYRVICDIIINDDMIQRIDDVTNTVDTVNTVEKLALLMLHKVSDQSALRMRFT